jgi:hypothetical protein
MMKRQTEVFDSIMIHVPEAYFGHEFELVSSMRSYEQHKTNREHMFRRFYEQMGTVEEAEESCFYHFITKVPASPQCDLITTVYVCFLGKVQYKSILVKFIKNEPVMLPNYQHPEPRDWCVTTGPVQKPPHDILLSDVWKGMRQGFRYTHKIF